MASEQDDAVFDQDLDDESESSQSQSLDDDLENDDVLVENDDVLVDEDLLDDDDDNHHHPHPHHQHHHHHLASVPLAVPAVTIAVSTTATTPPISSISGADLKRQRVESTPTQTPPTHTVIIKKPPPPLPPQHHLDDSRRGLFQRLWTDEDEIELLQGFLDYTTQRGTNHHDTALFYDQIKSKLQLDFNKNQLVEKLRRLKKKYRNVVNKISSGKDFAFKSPHDQATFEISRKIWSVVTGRDGNLDDDDGGGSAANPNPNPNFNNNPNLAIEGVEVKIEDQKSTPRPRKRARSSRSGSGKVVVDDKRVVNDVAVAVAGFNNVNDNNNNNNNNNNIANNVSNSFVASNNVSNLSGVSGLIEETVKSCLSPLFKELLSNAMNGGCGSGGGIGRGVGGLAMNAMPLSFGGGEMIVDEKWRKQQILELEVYSKRLELVQDQIRAQLDELRSMGG